MPEHVAESQREWQVGLVVAIYPDTWEVDVRLLYGSSAVVRRAKVLAHFLPELHAKNPDGSANPARQSKVLVGRVDAYQQSPVAIPIHNVIVPDAEKPGHVFWSEHLNFRLRVDRAGNLEIRNLKDGRELRLRIEEDGGVVRVDTPRTRIILRDEDGGVTIECDETVTVNCKNARVTADQDARVNATSIFATAEVSLVAYAKSNAMLYSEGACTVAAQGPAAVVSNTAVNISAGGAITISAPAVAIN